MRFNSALRRRFEVLRVLVAAERAGLFEACANGHQAQALAYDVLGEEYEDLEVQVESLPLFHAGGLGIVRMHGETDAQLAKRSRLGMRWHFKVNGSTMEDFDGYSDSK